MDRLGLQRFAIGTLDGADWPPNDSGDESEPGRRVWVRSMRGNDRRSVVDGGESATVHFFTSSRATSEEATLCAASRSSVERADAACEGTTPDGDTYARCANPTRLRPPRSKRVWPPAIASCRQTSAICGVTTRLAGRRADIAAIRIDMAQRRARRAVQRQRLAAGRARWRDCTTRFAPDARDGATFHRTCATNARVVSRDERGGAPNHRVCATNESACSGTNQLAR